MKFATIALSSVALALSAGLALADGGGWSKGGMSKSKSFYYAKSANVVAGGQIYKYKSNDCGCKGEVNAYTYKKHDDYAEKTKYGYKAGGEGISENYISWKNANVKGVGATFAAGYSAVGFGKSESSHSIGKMPKRGGGY